MNIRIPGRIHRYPDGVVDMEVWCHFPACRAHKIVSGPDVINVLLDLVRADWWINVTSEDDIMVWCSKHIPDEDE
jgi:hypothetical protein